MQRLITLSCLTLAILSAALFPAHAAVEDTPLQVPSGIAVGYGLNIEISFPSMSNSQGCGFNGAYVIDSTVDAASRQSMVSALLLAKEKGWGVRVRLLGCSDRPKFHYVFVQPTW